MQLFLIHVNYSKYLPWKNSCKFSNPYIFVIRWCKSLKFQMKVISRVDYESSFSHLLKFHFRICDKTFFIFSKYFKYINCHTLSVLAHRGENQDKNNKFRISEKWDIQHFLPHLWRYQGRPCEPWRVRAFRSLRWTSQQSCRGGSRSNIFMKYYLWLKFKKNELKT